MVIRQYPDDIKKMIDMYQPYAEYICDGELKEAPPEVIEAFNKVKKWIWEQGQ